MLGVENRQMLESAVGRPLKIVWQKTEWMVQQYQREANGEYKLNHGNRVPVFGDGGYRQEVTWVEQFEVSRDFWQNEMGMT